ncbi:MAG: hypothetical protein ACRBDI_05180 [Alphaproteobacteria bacterium]
MKFLFTFILNYLDGTYISQVREDNLNKAIKLWLDQLDLSSLDIDQNLKDIIIKDFSNENWVTLENMNNVWCQSSTIDDELFLVNVVKTSE